MPNIKEPFLFCFFMGIAFGCAVSYKVTSIYYDSKINKIKDEYIEKLLESTKLEDYWERKYGLLEQEFINKKREYKASTDSLNDVINSLHNKLSSSIACGMPKGDNSKPVTADGTTNGEPVARGIEDIISFSARCARQADELTAQVKALQQYIITLQK